jgi:PhoH-like ATPase
MIKNFVLDTNVLVHDPSCIEKFEDNVVIIPFPVLEEIDKLKSKDSSVGKSAREVNRTLDSLREKGKLTEGITLNSGGKLRVVVFKEFSISQAGHLTRKAKDNDILMYTIELRKREKEPVYLVTKDINLRIKADVLGIPSQDYLADKVSLDERLSGRGELEDDVLRQKFQKDGSISEDDVDKELISNEFVFLGEDVWGRVTPDGKRVESVSVSMKTSCWGISPRNREQMIAMDLLLNDEVKFVALPGRAGTGKTLLSLACGLRKVSEENKYERLLVTRPLITMGKDVGYLPGSLEEKARPWMQPIRDNLMLLFSNRHMDLDSFLKKGDKLQMDVLSYIRGRTIPNQFIIIDESQNLTPHEVKTILTRVGDNTKIVLTGDPYQIDNFYLDTNSCGLVYAASRFVGNHLAGHVTLVRGERSELASAAADLL